MSKKDWNAIIAEYKTSGVSQSQFCKSRGVGLSSFSYHLQRSRESGAFVRVDAGERVELELPGGVVLRVSERNLGSVLKALQA